MCVLLRSGRHPGATASPTPRRIARIRGRGRLLARLAPAASRDERITRTDCQQNDAGVPTGAASSGELSNDDGVLEPFEVGIGRDELSSVALRRRVDDGVRHREAPRQREIRRLQRQRLVDRHDRRASQRGDGRERVLLGEVAADDLVDFVDLDCRD